MFPYRVKSAESEYDIQNSNFLYKINQKHQNTFDVFEFVWKRSKRRIKHIKLLLCILYNFHNSYFVMFVSFAIWVILYNLYYTC